jgi:hypothetical protein
MGYLPQFKNDLFISYRRVSNEAPDKWIFTFCKELKACLDELVGDVKIWLDEDNLRTGQVWRSEVAEALDGAAIFLAIISRTYLDSDECRKELDRFLGLLKDPTRGSERKIVPILKQPPKPEQELPHEMGEIHRHEFFRLDRRGSNHFRELAPNRDDAEGWEFWEALARLAQDIGEALETLKGCARQRAMGKVFIARVSPELQLERERLRSDLQQRGYLVVPEQEYLWNADDHRDRITRDLESARLCIHLVGCTASIEPTAALCARLQLELAHEAMKRKARPEPMVWIQPASDIHASARELLDYIKNDLANEGVPGGLQDPNLRQAAAYLFSSPFASATDCAACRRERRWRPQRHQEAAGGRIGSESHAHQVRGDVAQGRSAPRPHTRWLCAVLDLLGPATRRMGP